MLILGIVALWSVIAIGATLLIGELIWHMGSAMPDRQPVPIARPIQANTIRRPNNTTRGMQ